MDNEIKNSDLHGWKNIQVLNNQNDIDKIKKALNMEIGTGSVAQRIYIVFCSILAAFAFIAGAINIGDSLSVVYFAICIICAIIAYLIRKSINKRKTCKEQINNNEIYILNSFILDATANTEITYGFVAKIRTEYQEICNQKMIIDLSTFKRYKDGYIDNIVLAKCMDVYVLVNLSI